MPDVSAADIDATGSWMAYSREESLYLRPLEDWSQPSQRLADHDEKVTEIAFHPSGERVAAKDESGELRIWSTTGGSAQPLRALQAGDMGGFRFDPSGRWLAGRALLDGRPTIRLWDLTAPQSAVPLTLGRTDDVFAGHLAFHPSEPWLVTSNVNSAGFWPLATRYPWTLAGHADRVSDLVFTPSGDWLVSAAADGVRAWPLAGQNAGVTRVLLQRRLLFADLDLQASGERLAVAAQDGTVLVFPLTGGPVQELAGYARSATRAGILVAFSPDGRQLAAVPRWASVEEEMVIRVWDLASGDARTFGPVVGSSAHIGFIDEDRLRWSGRSDARGGGGETIFGLEDGSREVVADSGAEIFRTVDRQGSFILTTEGRGTGEDKFDLFWRSLESGDSRRITSHGDAPWAVALDPTDRWMVTGGYHDGLVRVGPVSGAEPHLLYGHQGLIQAVAVSPDGRWIASGGDDSMVRLWPMPDLSQPPLHTRPLDDLLATLRSLTNLRVVEAADLPTGWQVEAGPFPGWQEVPAW
jgi:WD40 repeat protein